MLRRSAIFGLAIFASLAAPTTSAVAGHSTLSATDAYAAAASGNIILLDIRTPQEWRDTGIGQGALGLDMTSRDFLKMLVAIRRANPKTPIALICATGGRSAQVNQFLDKNNFGNMIDVPEGMLGAATGPGWLKTNLPVYRGSSAEIRRRLLQVLEGG